MPSVLFYRSATINITDTNCTNGVQWILNVMGECVENDIQYASVVIGLLSIAIWMIVGFPQMYQNCRHRENIESLSVFFLIQWLLGDSCNLIGSILSEQLAIQTYTAIYFVFADIVLLLQYSYFRLQLRNKRKEFVINVDSSDRLVTVWCLSALFVITSSVNFLSVPYSKWMYSNLSPISPHHRRVVTGRRLLTHDLQYQHFFYGPMDASGYAIGILSSLLYVGSRTAQIYNNIKRGSTDGVSPAMFSLAILGNLTYGIAVFLRSQEAVFLLRHLPWIVGSIGIVLFDCFIVAQTFWYRRKKHCVMNELGEPLLKGEI